MPTRTHDPDGSDSADPISRERRERLLGQSGKVLWFTGLSGAGKTTLACEIERRLHARGVLTSRLDGDIVRGGLNSDLGFTPAARAENIRRMTEVAHILSLSGVVVLVAAISPYERDRKAARERIGADRFKLLHVATSIEVCEHRDPKGLYKKARAGELADFTGISAPYEIPAEPDLRISTDTELAITADRVMEYLTSVGVSRRAQ